ncbi:MAG TPA: PDZ domain-containing protein [Chitinophagaceae bacterium]
MKKYLLRASGVAALAVLLSTSVFSQEEKEKVKEKEKINKGDEVIIITKGNKDGKVIVEVKDGEVTVNGKPVDEYKDGDIIVRRNRSYNGSARVYAPSPFRGQAWSYDDNLFDGRDRAYLGVSTEKSDGGARITEVNENTAAEKAGLKEGDIITHVGETRINDHDDLSAAVRKHKPEDKVTVTYKRDGREQKATVTLGKHSAMTLAAPRFEMAEPLLENFRGMDGFGQTFSFNGRPRLGIRAQDTEDGKGVKVLSVDEGSAADKAGIKQGDIITEFEGKSINSADELASAARSTKDQSAMKLKLQRDGRSQTVEVKIPKRLKTTNL